MSFGRTNFLQLQPSIRPVQAQVTSRYLTVERATKTLHRMSPCTPVSDPAKITWYRAGDSWLVVTKKGKRVKSHCSYCQFSTEK